LETEKLSQEMSRRVSQLSIINPAKTGQTGQMSQMFVSSKVQSGAVIQRPCLCMIATSFNCTVMERRKRLRRGAGYGRDWLTEVMKRGKETPSVSHRFSMTAIPAMNGGMVAIVFLKGWVAIIEDSFSRNHPTTVHGEEVTQTIPKLTYMI
jgi:hypothetical protein